MPSPNKIIWNQANKTKLLNIVRPFNAKLTRLTRAYPDIARILPSRLRMPNLMQTIETEEDLTRNIESYRRFLYKNAEMPVTLKSGETVTQWEIDRVSSLVMEINRKRADELARSNPSSFTGSLNRIYSNNLLPKQFDLTKISNWERYRNSAENQARSFYEQDKYEQYKNNYINAIIGQLGTGDAATLLYQFVNDLDAEFVYFNYFNNPYVQIEFIYTEYDIETLTMAILNSWYETFDNFSNE